MTISKDEKFNKSLSIMYQALKSDKIHPNWEECSCAPCSYFYLRKIEKRRMKKVTFFLYWLAFFFAKKKYQYMPIDYSREVNWDVVLNVFYEIADDEDKRYIKTYYLEPHLYSYKAGHCRMAKRLDKKFNLYVLYFKKKWHMYWEKAKRKELWDIQAKFLFPFFQSFRKYNNDIRYDLFFDYAKYKNSDFREEFESMLGLFRRVAHWLIRTKAEDKNTFKQRDLQQALRVKQLALLPVLDALETKEMVKWNRAYKEISLQPDLMNKLAAYIKEIELYLTEYISVQKYFPQGKMSRQGDLIKTKGRYRRVGI